MSKFHKIISTKIISFQQQHLIFFHHLTHHQLTNIMPYQLSNNKPIKATRIRIIRDQKNKRLLILLFHLLKITYKIINFIKRNIYSLAAIILIHDMNTTKHSSRINTIMKRFQAAQPPQKKERLINKDCIQYLLLLVFLVDMLLLPVFRMELLVYLLDEFQWK